MNGKSPIKVSLIEIVTLTECNLNCIGCTSFSDYDIHDTLNWSDIKQNLAQWLTRITPDSISLFGGEPLMLANLPEMIRDVRSMAPDSMIHIVTNGTYVKKRKDVLQALYEVGHSMLTFSIHQPDKPYTEDNRQFLLDLYDWKPSQLNDRILESGNKFYLEFRQATRFMKTFRGDYANAEPFDSDPDEAFKICCFFDSLQLYRNKLYKCNPLALLPKVLTDWGLQSRLEWQPYLGYQPLSVDCSDLDLLQFTNLTNQSIPECRMCPTISDPEGQRQLRGLRTKKLIPLKSQTQNNELRRRTL